MSSKFLQLPFYERYKNYLQNSINCSMEVFQSEFPKNQSRLVASIISELMDALIILNQGKENFYRVPWHVSLPERYRHEYRDKQFDEQTLEPMEKALQRMTCVKLENEIELLRLILVDLVQELVSSMSFTHLQSKVREFLQDAKTEYDFIQNFVSNNDRVVELKLELKQSKDNGERLLKDLNDEIMNLESHIYVNNRQNFVSNNDRVVELKLELKQSKDNGERLLKDLNDEIMNLESHIYDIQIQNELKFCLVSKWEQTRHQQANIILSNEEKKLLEMCNDYKVKIDREQIAINDIQNFLKFQIDDLSKQIDNWVERYAIEVKELDVEIGQLKEAIQDVKSKNEDITGQYNLRQIDINEYRDEQRILEEKRKFEEKQCNSAIRIQSWWRGVMVRMELGPYRPKKKNKKGGKKK